MPLWVMKFFACATAIRTAMWKWFSFRFRPIWARSRTACLRRLNGRHWSGIPFTIFWKRTASWLIAWPGGKLYKLNSILRKERSRWKGGFSACLLSLFVVFLCCASTAGPLKAQVESVASPGDSFSWISHGRIEGHLALTYSPAGAFSPDSSTLAIATENKIALFDLRKGGIEKVLRPHVETVTDLEIQSANFLTL